MPAIACSKPSDPAETEEKLVCSTTPGLVTTTASSYEPSEEMSFMSSTASHHDIKIQYLQLVTMDAIKKQAGRIRGSMARQQQAMMKQFVGPNQPPNNLAMDEMELQQQHKLERLYNSTRLTKHYQKEIVHALDSAMSSANKQYDTGNKLSEDSKRYGLKTPCTTNDTLARAALTYADARAQIEKERATYLKTFRTQVADPLKSKVVMAQLDDARHLNQRYDTMRQGVEIQANEVQRRQIKIRETPTIAENNAKSVAENAKLETATQKLQEMKSNLSTIGMEATNAMADVETNQQKLTLQQLIAMVEVERGFQHRLVQMLDQLEVELREIEASGSNSNMLALPPPSYGDAPLTPPQCGEGPTPHYAYPSIY